jgi:hypothetical protein
MNKDRISKNVLNIKSILKMHKEDKVQDGNKTEKMSCRRKEEYGKKLRKSCGKTDVKA